MRLTGLIIVVLLLSLQYRLWVSDDGLVALWNLEKQVGDLRAENRRIKARNDLLKAEVRDLKHGTGAIEARARRELGMIGKGEVLYQFANR